jgi:hypothetical protein
MKRVMIALGAPSTGERPPRQAEVQPAVYVVAGGAARVVCCAADSLGAIGQCKRRKDVA